MDTRSALLIQLESLARQLLEVEKAVQSPNLDAHLRQRVGPRFDTLLSQRRTQLKQLQQKLSNNQPLEACWSQFSQLELKCRDLFEEALAFVQGALARSAKVDEGMCLLADNLLDDLAVWADVGWRRFTLLATGELYRETADVVRIRFPEVSLWGLPTVAHEFGHFLGPELRENLDGGFRYPFQEMLKEADKKRPSNWPLPHSTEWHHLHEHFADLFATYTLGPAFACSFVLLRLNPVDAYGDSATHPSHAKRVHSILWMLGRMNQSAPALLDLYGELIRLLRELWKQSLVDVGQPGDLPNAEIALLQDQLNDLYALLTTTTPTELAYGTSDWQRSQGIASGLLSNLWSPGNYSNAEVSRRDVLNAAWLSRLQLSDPNQHYTVDLGDVSSRALEIYRNIPPCKL
jgi:hypothetical protein